LAARSSYFAAALQGGFLESQQKMVELQVSDEQAVVDLKLLHKLSYSGSYIHDEDVLLDLQTRMRLAVLADALEFRECVDAIFSSFVELSTFEEALVCFVAMPEELQNHQFMGALANKIIKSLATAAEGDANAVKALGMVIDQVAKEVAKDKTEEDRMGDMLRQTGDALPKALGPIALLFETAPYSNGGSLYDKLSLKSFVKNLSVDAVAAFLKSSALRLRVENEAYYLLCAWIINART